MQPEIKVSVIITNYNYGHFLTQCIDSVLGQSDPATEIIIVDDGSTDYSRDVLLRYGNTKTILQQNGGQASAFNAGFKASTGDIIMFLDADDVLKPNAIETVKRHWNEKFAAICFELELIDESGTQIGRYPMSVPRHDSLPNMLITLDFEFMPTSGNAFARNAIEKAFPLPTARWKISADAVLVRVALLYGKINSIPFVLGSYRAHGSNGYFRDDANKTWLLQRAFRDKVEVAEHLANERLCPIDITSHQRALLLQAALRYRIQLADMKDNEQSLFYSITKILGIAVRQRLPIRQRLGQVTAITLLLFTAPLSKKIRLWAKSRSQRPRVVDALKKQILGRAFDNAAKAAFKPRWTEPLAMGYVNAGRKKIASAFNFNEWRIAPTQESIILCGKVGHFQAFVLNSEETLAIEFEIQPSGDGKWREVAIFSENDCLIREVIAEKKRITVVCKSPPPSASTSILNFRFEIQDMVIGFRKAIRQQFSPSARIAILSVGLRPTPALKSGAVLPFGSVITAAEVANSAMKSENFRLDGGNLRLLEGNSTLRFYMQHSLNAPLLSVILAPEQTKGWLTVHVSNELVHQGKVGPNSKLNVRMPTHATPSIAHYEVIFIFTPSDAFDESELVVAAFGWNENERFGNWQQNRFSAEPNYLLSNGEFLTPPFEHRGSHIFGEGWKHEKNGQVLLLGSLGTLNFSTPPNIMTSPKLIVTLAPLAPSVVDMPIIVAISINGLNQQSIQLSKQSSIEINLSPKQGLRSRRLTVGIHVAMVSKSDGLVKAIQHSGIRLESIEFIGDPILSLPNVPVSKSLSSEIITKLETLVLTATRFQSIYPNTSRKLEIRELISQRDDVVKLIDGLSSKAAGFILSSDRLTSLLTVTRALRGLEAQTSALLFCPNSTDDQKLKSLAIAILSSPPSKFYSVFRFEDLYFGTSKTRTILASYLVSVEFGGISVEDLSRQYEYYCKLLIEIKNSLTEWGINDYRSRFSLLVLEKLQIRQFEAQGRNILSFAHLYGAAIEISLSLKGHALGLTLPPAAPKGRVIQMAILCTQISREAADFEFFNSVMRNLGGDFFNVTFFTSSESEDSSVTYTSRNSVFLDGLTIDASVSEIRSHRPDVFILGADIRNNAGFLRIVAHRLAPVQIALSSFAGWTTGLSSFDYFIVSSGCSKKKDERQFTERVIYAPSSLPHFLSPTDRTNEEGEILNLRQRLGIPDNGMLLVSGAQAFRIGLALLNAWMTILRDIPSSSLVLYPYPDEVSESFPRLLLKRRIEDACDAHGIDKHRVLIFETLSRSKVASLLAVADVYLDSFPYSGARCVAEALEAQCPTVTLSGDTERGQRGADILSSFNIQNGIAYTVDDYCNLAVRYCSVPESLTSFREVLKVNCTPALFDIHKQEFSNWFGQFLLSTTAANGEGNSTILLTEHGSKYLFHHMPKTGGTTVVSILSNWFNFKGDYQKPWSRTISDPSESIDLDTVGSDDIICGHFQVGDGTNLKRRYPKVLEDRRWRLLTVVRDPLEIALSLYFFEAANRQKFDPSFEPTSVDEFLSKMKTPLARHFDCTEDNWRVALDRYWFIGTLERINESFILLADELGKPRPEHIPHLNASKRESIPSSASIAAFRERNALDYMIYSEINKRLEERIAKNTR